MRAVLVLAKGLWMSILFATQLTRILSTFLTVYIVIPKSIPVAKLSGAVAARKRHEHHLRFCVLWAVV